jgi:hypothetical protein
MARLGVGLVALVSVLSSACSFVLTKGPQPEVQPPPECTTSVGAPIADTVLAVASVGVAVLGGLMVASATCDQYHCPEPGESLPPAVGRRRIRSR